ncbi:Fe-Mn family superoxide dismutase [Patescibacteria group bacterium]|nr:Fe-Mn family superoxide dismutase [Patescibacteria group bacterium]MBU1721289.1 Fe-Mn family superoxide dismutase [Patescibacteria group bacterium]MBU1901003.1 Fe-Mn family superoxide dismutase [Patescibacteria group bacterium]
MYTEKKYTELLGLAGFSDDLLQDHFALYSGYVKNTNAVANRLKEAEKNSPEYNELKRRFGWEFNGMRLHEYYFDNLSKDSSSLKKESALAQKLSEEFGGVDEWEKDFKATASMRGIGWVILAKDAQTGKLFNTWINEHDGGHLAGATPLLVLDVFEHAFIRDYGLKKADYLCAFFKALNWTEVEKRFA